MNIVGIDPGLSGAIATITPGGLIVEDMPTVEIVVNGKFLAIEAKAGKGQATALQLKNLDAIQKCGGYPLLIREDNLEYLTNVIKECNAN